MGRPSGAVMPVGHKALQELINAGRGQADHASRIEAVSAKLLGTPYKLGVSGEGKLDVYDQDPLWRLDAFDCTTYIETVMAAAAARDPHGFERALFSVRYERGRVSYVTRNHFPEADWIPNNERAGHVRDITRSLFPDLAKDTSLLVSKAKWYAAKTANDIEPKDRDAALRERLASELRALSPSFADEPVTLSYLPMQSFYVKNPENGELEPNLEVLRKIPSGAIFNIVREGWTPGGHALAISHRGFLIQKADGLFMRHASTNKQVMEDRIDIYFKRFLDSPTVRGINILQALEPSK
jgi:hypothetical protein